METLNLPTLPPPIDPADLILVTAAGLIRRGWCQRNDAQDKDGKAVAAESPEAVRWCLIGAIFRAAFDLHGTRDTGHMASAMNRLQAIHSFPADWNDDESRNAEQVARELERAAGVAHPEPV